MPWSLIWRGPWSVFVRDEGECHSIYRGWRWNWLRNQQGRVWYNVESGGWDSESIKNRVESTGGCVKLKTVTEIRQSSAHNTFIAESVYLVLHSLWDWEPVERLKQRSKKFSPWVLHLFGIWSKQHSCKYDEGYGQRKQADDKGDNCSCQGKTDWVRWPVSLYEIKICSQTCARSEPWPTMFPVTVMRACWGRLMVEVQMAALALWTWEWHLAWLWHKLQHSATPQAWLWKEKHPPCMLAPIRTCLWFTTHTLSQLQVHLHICRGCQLSLTYSYR